MINCNGTIAQNSATLIENNRAFLYGDGVFETMKVVDNKILFFEDHYFRLMASMRILRMQIPTNFTLEYLEEQILATTAANSCANCCRVRLTVYRNMGGLYLPDQNLVSFIIDAKPLQNNHYFIANSSYEVDLYKDFFIAKQLLSNLKTTNRLVNITGSIFAKENDYHNCILLNNDKNVVEFLNGNLFMLYNGRLITPPLKDGCINGIMRKQILAIAKKIEGVEVLEQTISTFDLQKADELFCTNSIIGIQPVFKYRKKEYQSQFSESLVEKLNQNLI